MEVRGCVVFISPATKYEPGPRHTVVKPLVFEVSKLDSRRKGFECNTSQAWCLCTKFGLRKSMGFVETK